MGELVRTANGDIEVPEGKCFCLKCKKVMAEVNFYTHKNGKKDELCKACLTMHVNNYKPETYLWILEKFDVPYIEEEWNILRDRAYKKDPNKVTGMSIIGKYLSKMKLKQWSDYTWADTERLKQEKMEISETILPEDKLAEMKKALENGEISEAQYLTYAATQIEEPVTTNPYDPANQVRTDGGFGPAFTPIELEDVGADLTDEDKTYLAIKWGVLYSPADWVALEKLFNEFMESFDIQGAARLDTLKKICKTSLKMDQAIDSGDIDSYQKLSRVYDAMMKAAKFTEAQNKEGKGDFVDSVGEIVAYCEKNGGKIPRFEIDTPFDIVDKIIDDLKEYNKSLIYEDKALAREIEKYLKNRENQEAMKRDKEEAKAKGLDYRELTIDDYQDFSNAIKEDQEQDKELKADGEE